MEISWTDRVKNEVKEESNILHITNQKKAHWTGHVLHRNCRLKHVFEGKNEKVKEM
jgi:hypothetical protein